MIYKATCYEVKLFDFYVRTFSLKVCEWLIYYRSIIGHTTHLPEYIIYTRRFGSWPYSHVQYVALVRLVIDSLLLVLFW